MSRTLIDLPDLSSDYLITPEQTTAYQRDGHILLRSVCSPEEIAAYRPVINDATYRYNTQTRPLEERDTYGKAFLQVMNLWTQDDAVKKFVLARRFGKIAAELMGVEGVRLYHDQALYKEAGGGHTPWHQDQFYWPLDTNHTITLWMPLVDVPVEMGVMTFASGSHKAGFLGHLAISDESQQKWEALVKERGYPLATAPMKAGDATFHSGWTLHSAPGNASHTTREVMTIIFFAEGTRIMPNPDNPNRLMDLKTWHPGIQPGEIAASKLNPVVYHK